MKHILATLLLAACGNELHHTVDAQPADTSADTSVPVNGQPPADAVSVTITRQGVAQAGVAVVFQDPSSTLIDAATTDTEGRAWARMPAGGFVTSIEHVGSGVDELTTFATVVNGDALRLDIAPLDTGTDKALTVTVPIDGTASSYGIQTSCGAGGADATGTGSMSLVNCGPTTDLVIASYLDGVATGRVLYAPGVALPATGNVVIAGVYEELVASSLTYTNVPAQVALVSAYQAVSAVLRAYDTSGTVAPAGGTATIGLKIPPTTGSVLTVSTLYPVSGEVGQQALYDWDTAAPTLTRDLATALLPAYATAPVYDVTTHTATWTERAGGPAADLVRATLNIFRDDIPVGRAWHWHLAVARGSTPSVKFPTLPSVAGFDFNPASADTAVVDELTELRLPGGLTPWRTQVFGPTAQSIIGAAGHIALQTLYFEQL